MEKSLRPRQIAAAQGADYTCGFLEAENAICVEIQGITLCEQLSDRESALATTPCHFPWVSEGGS